MKHGRYEELLLGLKAGNRFTYECSQIPGHRIEIKGIKRVRGVLKVNFGNKTRYNILNASGTGPSRDVWQAVAPGDTIRGTGAFAPVYTYTDLTS